MPTSERNPPIDEIIGLIHKHSPEALDDLRMEFPDQASELFKLGITAGGSAAELAARRMACLTGLRVAIAVCESVIPNVKRKLKNANRLRLVSDVTTAIAGASVVTVLVSDFKKPVEYAVGAVAFCGTVLGLVTSYATGVIRPGDGSLYDYYKRLVEYLADARQLTIEINLLEAPFAETNISDLITRGNVLCREVTILEASI